MSRDHPLVLGGVKTRTDRAFAALDAAVWQRYSCGDGARGRRWYDWAWIHLDDTEWMLARRSVGDPSELAFYRCWATRPAGLPELVRVAGSRWSVEEVFQATKNEVGLDHYQVRKHTAWYRHITLSMVADAHLAFLAAGPPGTRSDQTGEEPDGLATQGAETTGRSHPDHANRDDPGELIPLTVNEIRRLHAHLNQPQHSAEHRIHWSHWRRRHQARAR